MSDEQHPTGDQHQTPDDPAGDRLTDDPWLLDRVLSGEAGAPWAAVADLFVAASGPAEADELAGERESVASFVAARTAAPRQAGRVGTAQGARRVAMVSTLMAGKFAAVTVAGVVTLGAGGMAAAAYSGILPAPLQDVAHRAIGAPLPNRNDLKPAPSATPSASPTTPAATRHHNPASRTSGSSTASARSVGELCASWRLQQLATTGSAYARLTKAAHGTSLDVFCAPQATATTDPTSVPTTTPTGEPTSSPSATASPSETPTSTGPATASDAPTTPSATASGQPTPPPLQAPDNQPTGQ
jgi:hypothetical protein